MVISSAISTLLTKINTAVGNDTFFNHLLQNVETIAPHRKTIVLDLDNTLIHATFSPLPYYDFTISFHTLQEHSLRSSTTCYVQTRPILHLLLHHLPRYNYQIIIFTSASKQYADPILDKIGLDKSTHLRLYRDSCTFDDDGTAVKDLRTLGTDLKDIIVVDDDPGSYKWQPENALPITRFYGDLSDRDLWKVLEVCRIAAQCRDVRDSIRTFLAMNPPNVRLLCGQFQRLGSSPRGLEKTIVLEVFDVLVTASLEPLPRHDFVLSLLRDDGLGTAEIVPFYVAKRPGVEDLLSELAQSYEIVIYTSAPRKYADLILDKIDVNSYGKVRFYESGHGRVKDLGLISPDTRKDLDLRKIIHVDRDPTAYKLHKENGVFVKPYDGDLHDRELFKLMELCKRAAKSDDVRKVLRGQRNGWVRNGRNKGRKWIPHFLCYGH